jgi:type II secretory pathway pseudopilin PulG
MDRSGFTIIEMTVAILILTTAILGMGASSAFMIQSSSGAAVKSEALQAVEGRISQIATDPRYQALDSLYAGTESDLPGLYGYDRVTEITHVLQGGTSGRYIDYKTVSVTVSGPGLTNGISRTSIVGAP